MQNSMVVFDFSILDQKYPFGANLTQKIKIVRLSLHLVPRLPRICSSIYFLRFRLEIPFLRKFGPKIQNF